MDTEHGSNQDEDTCVSEPLTNKNHPKSGEIDELKELDVENSDTAPGEVESELVSKEQNEITNDLNENESTNDLNENEESMDTFLQPNENTKDSIGIREEKTSIDNTSSVEENNQGNLLSNLVTMHMTDCDDDYSPTLAICDIFNKESASSEVREEKQLHTTKEDECKDEFLIIDLDTCKMERSSKKQNNCNVKNKANTDSNSPSKGLILVNLSQDEISAAEVPQNSDTKPSRDKNEENNFLNVTSDFISNDHLKILKEKSNIGTRNVNEIYSQVESDRNVMKINDDECIHQVELYLPTKTWMRNEVNYSSKGVLFPEIAAAISQDSNISRETYSSEVSLHSNDSNISNENEDCDPAFCMPEMYTKFYDKSNDHPSRAFTKMSTLTTNLDMDNQYYNEYGVNDNSSFENSFSSTQTNVSATNEFYEHHANQISPHYYFDDKVIKPNNLVDLNLKQNVASPNYKSSRYQENTQHRLYKSEVAMESECRKFPFYTTIQHTSNNPFFHSSFIPNYRAPYSYSNLRHPTASHPILSSSLSNHSDWNSRSAPFYEINLNAFGSVHNKESQYHQGKDDWPTDANVPELYHDPQIGQKSYQTDNDSEATEDADETDDVPIFFDNSTDFSPCDNISNMSVMSGSYYSDSPSVMTPASPSDFTPSPSISNTPIPPAPSDVNSVDDHKFSIPFTDENSRSDPIHLYSPTMLSVAPYGLANDRIECSLVNYNHNQSAKNYYPSMADMHNSRPGLSISSSSRYEDDDNFDFAEYRNSHKSQIQSDKISTSTSRTAHNIHPWTPNLALDGNQQMESYVEFIKQEGCELRNELRKLRHNEPLRQRAIRIMSQWYEEHLENPYPTKDDKLRMSRDGGITVTQVKSWFANKRNRTNNTKPKVQKRAMKEKLKKLFQDLKHSNTDSLDNSHIIQQLSGIIQT